MVKKIEGNIYLVLLLILIPSVLFLLLPGFYEPHDLHHIADIYEMYRAIASGQIPPRLGPDFTFNYGYPLFNYYYLAPFYLGSLYFAVFGSLTFSFELVFVTSVALSLFGMYRFLRRYFDVFPSLAGATLFLYTPYRAVQIYVRGAMGEALALSLLPWVLVYLIKVADKPNRGNVAFGSIVMALFLISHNYLFLILAPVIGAIIIVHLCTVKNTKLAILGLVYTLLLSVGLTAYWWAPAILELGLVQQATPFNLIDHFPFIKQLIVPSWGYGSSVWGPGDELSFQIGAVNLLAVFLLFVLAFRNLIFGEFGQKRDLYFILTGLLLFFGSVFMMNIRSLPIWNLVPFINFIQFPWRLLIITTFVSSFLAALFLNALNNKKNVLLSFGLILLSIGSTFFYFRPSKIFYKNDAVYLNRFFALSGTATEEYLNYSEDYLLLPVGVERRPENLAEQKVEIESGRLTEVNEFSSVHFGATILADSESVIRVNKYYFPGWDVRVDGEVIQAFQGEPNGQIEFMVDEGKHEIEVKWRETVLRRRADIISLVSLMLVLYMAIRREKKLPFSWYI